MAHGVAIPLADVFGYMRTAIGGNHANVVDLFGFNGFKSSALHNLQIAVVVLRKQGRHVRPSDTPCAQRKVLRAVELMSFAFGAYFRNSGASLSRQRRNPPVRPDNNGSTSIPGELGLPTVQPELGEIIVNVVRRRAFDAGMVGKRLALILNLLEPLAFLLGKGLQLRFGVEFLSAKLLGSLQRCYGVVGPDPLKIGLAIRRSWRSPSLMRGVRLDGGRSGLCACGRRREREKHHSTHGCQSGHRSEMSIRHGSSRIDRNYFPVFFAASSCTRAPRSMVDIIVLPSWQAHS